MAIKKYYADADTTITNAFKDSRFNKFSRASGSNMGLADSLEVFSIYGQGSSSAGYSQELSRVLIKFPVTTTDDSTNSIEAHRTAGTIPSSGSVNFYLRMFNVGHDKTVPRSAKYNIFAVSQSWEEGRGLDMDEYKDVTRNIEGANWIQCSASTGWKKPGGDYHTGSADLAGATPGDMNEAIMYDVTLEDKDSIDDIEVDVTALVEQWIKGTTSDSTPFSNYGFGIFLTSSQEAYFSSSYPDGEGGQDYTAISGGILHNLDGATTSFYTKKFSARGSEYFFSRPVLEARWDSTKKDDRGNFYYSSSLARADENINTIYLYNYYRGMLRDIPNPKTGESGPNGFVYVSVFSGSGNNASPDPKTPLTLVADGTHVTTAADRVITGGWVETGIYSASFAITSAGSTSTELTRLFDVWFVTSSANQGHADGIQIHTGSIDPKNTEASNIAPGQRKVSSITNLKDVYSNDELARFRVYSRNKDWSPTIYTRANSAIETNIIESGSYRVYRIIDDLSVIPYGTASSTLHTQMSFDISGNYFDLDMGMLEPGYAYAIKFAYYNGSIGTWVEQPETFKFRVEKWA